MVPQDVPLQPLPTTLQETPVLEVPRTVVENCWLPPITTSTAVGEIYTDTGPVISTVARPDLLPSATEVAVTVI
jgi:hypothetical protein